MTSSFHGDSLQELTFCLLYGLLTEKEAEEFRSFLKTDSEAAQVFESVRLRVDMIVDFCSAPSHYETIAETGERNISLEPPSSDPFAFDAVVGSFESGVFVDDARDNKIDDATDQGTKALSSSRRKKNKKRLDNTSSQPRQNICQKGARDLVCDNLREGGSVLSKAFTLYLKRLGSLIRTSPLFYSILTLLIFWGTIIFSGAWLHERELRHYFQDDFRIQVAVPRFLVKDAVQTIVVKTSGVDGRPRRIPIRFSFTDPISNTVLSTHIEGGNSSGSILYELSDSANFPDRVLFTVAAEGMDSEVFKAELLTVDKNEIRQDSVADWLDRGAQILAEGNSCASKIIDWAYDDLVFQIDSENDLLSEKKSKLSSDSTTTEEEDFFRSVQLSFFPEMGKFVEAFSNHVTVFSSDDKGTPIASNFLLFREGEEEPIASFITNQQGVGSFDFVPRNGEKYCVAVVPNKHDFENHVWTSPPISKSTDDGISSFDDCSVIIDVDSSSGDGATCFMPAIVTEKLYFSLEERVLSASESLSLRISSLVRLPLLVVIEKSGVNVMQSFITSSEGSRKCSFTLPERLAGLMTLKLFSVGQDGVHRVGEIPFWRFPFEDDSPIHVDVEKGRNIEQFFFSENLSNNFGDNSQQSYVGIYWAQNVRDAIASLGIDEFLGMLDVSERNLILKTIRVLPQADLPVVFDNLQTLRERACLKLEQFNKNETKVFLWLIRLGVAGCYVTLIAVLFLSVFRAFTFSRGAFLLGIICVLLLYSVRSLSSLDYVDVSASHDVVFTTQLKNSHDEDELDNEKPINNVTSPSPLTYSKHSDFCPSFKQLAVFPLNESNVELNLENILSAEEIDSGVLVLKYCCEISPSEKTTVRMRFILGESSAIGQN